MVERVARKLCGIAIGRGRETMERLGHKFNQSLEKDIDDWWESWKPDAYAALEALREPTQEIIDAAEPAMRKVNHIVAHAGGVQWDNDEPPLAPAWRAMIDACLK